MIKWFLELTVEKNSSHHVKEHFTTVLEKGVVSEAVCIFVCSLFVCLQFLLKDENGLHFFFEKMLRGSKSH